jgi:uncharacterized membrane protein
MEKMGLKYKLVLAIFILMFIVSVVFTVYLVSLEVNKKKYIDSCMRKQSLSVMVDRIAMKDYCEDKWEMR